MRLSLDAENIQKSVYIFISQTKVLKTFSADSKAIDIFRGEKNNNTFNTILLRISEWKSTCLFDKKNRLSLDIGEIVYKNKAHKTPYEDEPNKAYRLRLLKY